MIHKFRWERRVLNSHLSLVYWHFLWSLTNPNAYVDILNTSGKESIDGWHNQTSKCSNHELGQSRRYYFYIAVDTIRLWHICWRREKIIYLYLCAELDLMPDALCVYWQWEVCELCWTWMWIICSILLSKHGAVEYRAILYCFTAIIMLMAASVFWSTRLEMTSCWGQRSIKCYKRCN